MIVFVSVSVFDQEHFAFGEYRYIGHELVYTARCSCRHRYSPLASIAYSNLYILARLSSITAVSVPNALLTRADRREGTKKCSFLVSG